MPRRVVVSQADFAFGELGPDYAASDADAKARSLKSGRNVRILNSYAFGQRPGSRRMATCTANGIDINLTSSFSGEVIGVIRAAGMDVYDLDGNLIQSVSGAPWSADDVMSLTWHTRKDELYVSHQGYWPRVFTCSPEGVWSLGLYAFANGAGGSKRQLYYRFASAGISVTPSALTGTIDVEFSEDVLEADHVGVRFRYGASPTSMKEFVIATVVDAQNGTATVIDDLPPTYSVVVADATGFRAGEDVEGKDSQAKGVIAAVNYGSDTLTVIMSEGFEGFEGSEDIVGPYTKSELSSCSTASPAASTVWDEAVFSEVRGYPGDVFEHAGRLGFTDYPNIPGAITMSAPGAVDDFDLGEGDASSAIFWVLKAKSGERVRYCVSASNLIVLSDRKAYYVPEDESTPLAANNFLAVEVGPAGASSAFPVIVEEGVVYVESGGNRVIGLYSTGDLGAPWRITDLSRRAAHLIKNPVSLAMTNGNAQSPERYIFALNDDGTLSCCFFDPNPAHLAWTPWDTDGTYNAMVSVRGIIYAICAREIGGETAYLLERLDTAAQLDASSLFSSSSSYEALAFDDGEAFLLDSDEELLTDFGALPHLAGQTVKLIRGTEYLGEFEVGDDGAISGVDAEDGDFEAGLHFDVDAVLWPPRHEWDQRTLFGRRRIPRVAVRVQDSCVYTVGIEGKGNAQMRAAYDQGDDMSEAPPQRSEVRRFVLTGNDYEPCVQITRPLPQPLTVLSVSQEITVT